MSYIDRETVIKKLRGYKVNLTSILSEEDTIAAAIDDGIDAAISVLSTMPSADVEPIRHGEWAVDTIYPSGIKKFHCSVCGQERTVHEKYEGVFRQNYCPNCGAHMYKGET